MYTIALILNGTVQHVGTYETFPQFAPPLEAIDITNYEEDVKEGYLYENSVFSKPTNIPVEPTEPEAPESEIPKLSSEEVQAQTLLNTEYLVIMSELSNL